MSVSTHTLRRMRFNNGVEHDILVAPPNWEDIVAIANNSDPKEFRLDGDVIVVNRPVPGAETVTFFQPSVETITFFQYEALGGGEANGNS